MSLFNGLSPEICELLFVLSEECGEVAQGVAKLLRHGIRENPYTGILNRESLEGEITDLATVVTLLDQLGVLDWNRIIEGIPGKMERMARPEIMHHSTLLKSTPCVRCGSIERIQEQGGMHGRDDGPTCKNLFDCRAQQRDAI